VASADPAPAAAGTAAISRAAPHVVELLLAGRGSLLRDIVSLIGIDRAARLIAAFGGMRLYVPHAPGPDDTLSKLIGNEAACALARVYGGDRIDVPNPTPRRIQIIELRASGVSIDGIARSLRCTRRRVFQVLAEVRRKQRFREIQQPR
jgi:Homeodomain-like domain-containing protein